MGQLYPDLPTGNLLSSTSERSSLTRLKRSWTPADLVPFAWFEPNESEVGDTLPNLMGGAAMTLGSAAGADANDPKWLPALGRKYLYNPGLNNGVRYSINADQFAPGDRTIRLYIQPDTWGNANDWLAGTSAGGELLTLRGWSDTSFSLYWKDDTATIINKVVNCSSLSAAAAGKPMWIEAALDVDDGAGNHVVTIRFSQDGETWTDEGSAVTAGVTTCVPAPSSIVSLGGDGGWYALTKILAGQHISGFQGGTVEADFDARNLTPTQNEYIDTIGSLGGTWTLRRPTSGRKSAVVDKYGLLLLGTDDSMQLPSGALPPFSATDDATFVMIYRGHAALGTTKRLLSNAVDAFTVGVDIYFVRLPDRLRIDIQDGTTQAALFSGTITHDGRLAAFRAGRRGTEAFMQWNDIAETVVDLSALAAGDLAGTGYTVGSSPTLADFSDIEFMALFTFDRALSDSEWSTLFNYYAGRY